MRDISFREMFDDGKRLEDYFEWGLDEFFRLDQFGEIVDLDGVKLRAQIVEYTADRRKPDIAHKQKNFYIHPEMHGINLVGAFCEIYFKAGDFLRERERIPKQTETVRVNGSRYSVVSSQIEYGVVCLELESDRQNVPFKAAARLPGLYE